MTPLTWTEMKAAEPRLEALELLVLTIAGHADRRRPLCYACAWSEAVKPLLTPLVGWQRGYVPEDAPDPTDEVTVLRLADLPMPERTVAGTDAERYLRSRAAWEIAADRLVAILRQADPGRGHGLGVATVAELDRRA
ncbi:MAG: hypothetical protein EPN50_10565, partial [Chloroflexota bacterium]